MRGCSGGLRPPGRRSAPRDRPAAAGRRPPRPCPRATRRQPPSSDGPDRAHLAGSLDHVLDAVDEQGIRMAVRRRRRSPRACRRASAQPSSSEAKQSITVSTRLRSAERPATWARRARHRRQRLRSRPPIRPSAAGIATRSPGERDDEKKLGHGQPFPRARAARARRAGRRGRSGRCCRRPRRRARGCERIRMTVAPAAAGLVLGAGDHDVGAGAGIGRRRPDSRRSRSSGAGCSPSRDRRREARRPAGARAARSSA